MIRLHATPPTGGEETEVLCDGPEECSFVRLIAARLVALDYEVTLEDSEGNMIPWDEFEEFEE